jgi:hypothetical protein
MGIPSLALRAPSAMPMAEAEGVLFIEESARLLLDICLS